MPTLLRRTALPALLLLTSPALAQQPPAAAVPFISVEGEASADVAPDTAHLTVGVVSQGRNAAAATSDLARATQAVVDQVKAEGIGDKDVATSSIDLAPVYPDTGNGGGKPTGFRASTDLVLTITPATRAGTVAADLVDKGANTIEGITYSSSQESKVLDDLLAQATREARRRAEISVSALGLHLGRALEIMPAAAGSFHPQPMMRAAMAAKAAAPAPIPTQPGSATLHASVTIRFEILP